MRERIELFIQVCEGVQHAHQKAIIHRDLKPSNILVIEVDGKPMPRIIDFGVAKIDLRRSSPPAPSTRASAARRDPRVHEPRAGRTDTQDIDTRTDVYSLGAVLYELLTGALPLDLKKLAYDEVLRVLREEDAPRPSTKVTTLGNDSTIAAKNRGSDPPTLVRQLRGDPDAIAIKALEKDRNRRYASASELAADIRRYLHSEPVTAHPPSIAYRTRKYLRRHRPASTVLGWLAGALSIMSLGGVTYYFATRQERPLFEHFSIEKAIDSEHVVLTAISPDGQYLASVLRSASGTEGLWIHHIPTSSDKAVVEEHAFLYHEVIFSPDGIYLYFLGRAVGLDPDAQVDAYRIPIAGGKPTRILEGAAWLSFIEGGQRLCFSRSASNGTKFLSANPDGSEEHMLVEGLHFPTLASCAPDGRLVALAYEGLEILDFSSGSRKLLVSAEALGGELFNLLWEPSGKGLFAIISKSWYGSQLVFISYPDGRLYPITNDLGGYSGIGLTADAKVIATTKTDSNGRFEVLSLEQPSQLEEYSLRGLTSFAWLDNEIIVASNDTGALEMIDLPKDEASTLNVSKGHFLAYPSLCGPNTLVVTDANSGIYQMQLDGSIMRRVTEDPMDYFPQCTPDGNWLFYTHRSQILKVSLGSGLTEKVIDGLSEFSLSSDGNQLASVNFGRSPQLHIFTTNPFLTVKTFQMDERFFRGAFSRDGKSIYYATESESGTTIWRQSLDSPTPVKVTSFPGKFVMQMRASPDNTKLGMTIRVTEAEAVLLRDVR